MEELTTIVSLINNVGFPIFVAIFLLFNYNKILNEIKLVVERNTQAIENLKEIILKWLDGYKKQ